MNIKYMISTIKKIVTIISLLLSVMITAGGVEANEVYKSSNFVKTFEGMIDRKHPIQMKLWKTGDVVFGYYLYKKNQQKIPVKGTIDHQDRVEINEFSRGNVKHKAIFKGKFENSKILGSWSKISKQDNPVSFSMTEKTPQYHMVHDTVRPYAGRYVYKVKKGDSLRKISQKYYKNEKIWPFIAVENDIKNPEHLLVGQRLYIPKLGMTFQDNIPPYSYPSELILNIDLDFDTIEEEISFDPYQTKKSPEKELYITCSITRKGKKLLTFNVASYMAGTVTVQDVTAWKVSDQAHILAVKTINDHSAAVASFSGHIHLFLLSSDMVMTHLTTIDGDSVQHHSAESGSNGTTTIQYVENPVDQYLYVKNQSLHGDTKLVNEIEMNSLTTTIKTYKLYYAPEEKKLLKREENSYATNSVSNSDN